MRLAVFSNWVDVDEIGLSRRNYAAKKHFGHWTLSLVGPPGRDPSLVWHERIAPASSRLAASVTTIDRTYERIRVRIPAIVNSDSTRW